MRSEEKTSTRIAVWIPDHQSSAGGIQVFSRFFIQALGDCLPDADILVLSKNDDSYPAFDRRVGSTEFSCAGWWPMPYRSVVFATKLVLRSLSRRPHLILMTHPNFSPVARLVQSITGVHYGVVAHGIDVWNVKSKSIIKGLRSANRIMAVSRFTRDKILSEVGADPSRVGVLPNTLDPNQFRPAAKPRYLLQRYGLRSDQPVILTVARLASLERYKGYDQILRALPAIKKSIPGTRYLLGGRGPDQDRIQQLARELGVDQSLILAGFIPDHELEDHYNLCDVFAMPSKGEGFGIVFLEALACGKAVLAGNRDGSVDAVLDGELGVLVDPDNVEAIANDLVAILKGRHPQSILRQPAELRRRVIDTYGYSRFVGCLAEHLRCLGVCVTAAGGTKLESDGVMGR